MSSEQLVELITEISEAISELANYSILILTVKNETAASFIESDMTLYALRVKFVGARIRPGDVIIPEKLRKVASLNYGEGELELRTIELKVAEEASFAFAVSNRLLAEMEGNNGKLVIEISGILPGAFDILTTGIKRSTGELFSGLIYFTPMGYPVTIKGSRPRIPAEITEYPLPNTTARVIIDYVEEVPIAFEVKEVVKKEVVIENANVAETLSKLKRYLVGLGLSPLYESEIVWLRGGLYGDKGVGVSYMMFRGSIKGQDVLLIVNIVGIRRVATFTVEGRSEVSGSSVTKSKEVTDLKIKLVAPVPRQLAGEVLTLLENLKEALL